MDFEKTKIILHEWARDKPFIRKLYICGSRARDDYREDSDIDIVLEIDQLPCDTDIETTWISEASKLRAELKPLLKWDFDLIRYDPNNPENTKYAAT